MSKGLDGSLMPSTLTSVRGRRIINVDLRGFADQIRGMSPRRISLAETSPGFSGYTTSARIAVCFFGSRLTREPVSARRHCIPTRALQVREAAWHIGDSGLTAVGR
jgi:hypothetical protein